MAPPSADLEAGADNPALTVPASQRLSPDPMIQAFTHATAGEDGQSSSGSTWKTEAKSGHLEAQPPRSRNERGWRRIVRNFSPSWFSVTMGTGIVAVTFYSIPFQARWLYWLSVIFFCLNTLLFALAFIASFLRYTIWPEIWGVMISDPSNSLFLGTIPMGFATLVEMWIFVCVPAFGDWAITFGWILWMIDAIAAAAVTVFLIFSHISSRHETITLSSMTATQLLPIAATIVAAGTGAEVADVLTNNDHAIGTIITSFVMWGMATPLALAVLVIYYQRLHFYKLPPREVVVSCFLPIGPLGFGGYGSAVLGKAARKFFPQAGTLSPLAGEVLYIQGWIVALIMWGFGLVWMVFALATIYKSRPIPFNMGWWGFTFPLGVFAASTIQIGVEMPSMVFKVLGTIFGVAVILLWIVVAAGTAKGAWSGKLFHAPCLNKLAQDK